MEEVQWGLLFTTSYMQQATGQASVGSTWASRLVSRGKAGQ